MASINKLKIKQFFDTEFDKNSIKKINVEKSNFIYLKITLGFTLIFILGVFYRLYFMPSVEEKQYQIEKNKIVKELNVSKENLKKKEEEIKSLNEYKEEKNKNEEFENNINKILNITDINAFSKLGIKIKIKDKEVSTDIGSLQNMINNLPKNNDISLIKITLVEFSGNIVNEEMSLLEFKSLSLYKILSIKKIFKEKKGVDISTDDILKM